MAMPWTRAKQIAKALRGDGEFPEGYKGSRSIAELNALFDAPARIQREASAAAGRHIPMIQENVKGAQPWVGRSAWNFGSYHLWGDVPALMPTTIPRAKVGGFTWSDFTRNPDEYVARGFNDENEKRLRDESRKNTGGSWFNVGGPNQKVVGANPVLGPRGGGSASRSALSAPRSESPRLRSGTEVEREREREREREPLERGDEAARLGRSVVRQRAVQGGIEEPRAETGVGDDREDSALTGESPRARLSPAGDGVKSGSKPRKSGRAAILSHVWAGPHGSLARKAASAKIAKIPAPLARHVAQVYYPG